MQVEHRKPAGDIRQVRQPGGRGGEVHDQGGLRHQVIIDPPRSLAPGDGGEVHDQGGLRHQIIIDPPPWPPGRGRGS